MITREPLMARTMKQTYPKRINHRRYRDLLLDLAQLKLFMTGVKLQPYLNKHTAYQYRIWRASPFNAAAEYSL
jgi:hypothetical protein